MIRIEKLITEGKFEEAEQLAKSTPMAETTRVAVLASIELKRGDHQKAEVLFERVIAADPEHIIAHGNLGQLLFSQGKHKRAIHHCEKAYKSAPKNEIYALNYAGCLSELDRVPEAIEALRALADGEKPSLRILLAMSSLLRADLKPNEALMYLERAKALYPDDTECERAMADVLAELNPREASKAFAAAEATAKNKVSLRWNWSFVELRLQNYKKGWELYENGLDERIGKIGRPMPSVVRMFKRETELEKVDPNKYTLFVCEQGIGDQILFLGCFDRIIEKFPKSILVAEDRMVPILQRSFPSIQVVTYGFAYSLANQTERLNGIFPIGSIQKYYRRTIEEFKGTQKQYLIPDQKRVEKYRKILNKTWPNKKIVGISWSGGFWDRQRKTKSYDFELFANLLKKKDGYSFVVLQYGDVGREREWAEKNRLPIAFIDGLDFKKDIDGWLALMCATDQILSVSTALVHFAGAAGKKVDVLLGKSQAPFVWGLNDGPSVAYAGVSVWRPLPQEESHEFFNRISDVLL